MDFELSDDHRLLRDTVRDFARAEVAPVAEALDHEKRFPYEIVARLGELDLMGIPFPEEYGGAGGDSLAYALAVEELARVDSSVAITLCAHTSLGTQPLYLFGSEAQKQEWMPRLCRGEVLGAFGLTEPEAGTDAGNTQTRAVLDGDEWVINGAKQFITNAGTDISAIVVITAVTGGGENGRKEISNLLVENGTPGYEPGPPYRKMGWNASDTRPLSFADCRVPAENLVGQRGAGLRQFLRVLDIGRIGVAAMGVGLAQGALDEALAYAKERRTFGQPISRYQTIQAKLADISTEIEATRHARPQGGMAEGSRTGLHADRGAGEAQERPPGGPCRRGGGPDPWRLRLHRGVSGVPLLPRREDPDDRRGNRRGPADGDRAGAGGVSVARQRRLLSLVSAGAALLGAADPALGAGAAPVGPAAADARLSGRFALAGVVTSAVAVRGEHRGQRILRTWEFAQPCAAIPCPTATLVRERPGGTDLISLHRTGPVSYAGTGSFAVPLRCDGRRFPRGELVPFTVTVTALEAVPTGFGPLVSRITARYIGGRRRNLTPCVLPAGHDAASYAGSLQV